MYQTYGQIYKGQNPKYRSNQNYLSDIQPCNKNIPVASITCPDYLQCCKPDSVNDSTNNTVDCKMRLFPPNWPYRDFNYFLGPQDLPQKEIRGGESKYFRGGEDESKYDWIRETYNNSRLNKPYNICKTCPYQGQLRPYMDLTGLYNPKFNQTTF